MSSLDGPVTAFLAWLNAIYTPSVAFLVSAALVVATAYLWWKRSQEVAPTIAALARANAALQPVRNAEGAHEARNALTKAYHDVAESILDSRDPSLRHAWDEFEESIVDPSAPQLSSSVHASEFFEPLIERSRGLFFWANIMVAIGLVFTFLGIMAALGNTAIAISNAGDSATMQSALQKLLNVTAAKFITSFAGVACSIVLRFGDRRFQDRVGREVRLLVDALERGLRYVPPQRIAADQLRQLEQIATAQTKFAQDLAVAIGEKLNEQMAPMVTVLGEIKTGIGNLKDELVGGVGGAVANTLNETAGSEMQALAAALTVMSDRLGAVPDQIGASADDANAKLKAAAELFSTAAAGMQAAFEALGQRVEAMGKALLEKQQAAADSLRDQTEAVARRLHEIGQRNQRELEAAAEGLRDLVSSMGATLEGIRSSLAAQAEESAKATGDMVARNQAALEAAAATAATRLSNAAAQAAERTADEVTGAVVGAMNMLSERVEAAMRNLTLAIDGGATKVQAFGGSIERASASAESQAAKLATAGSAAERVAGLLDSSAREAVAQIGQAGQALAETARPIREATTVIADSVANMRDALKAQKDQLDAQMAAMRELARQFETTSSAAQSAWESYQKRFEGVDQALERALKQMADAAADSAQQVTDYANKLDSHLGDAVGRLAAAIDELDDLPDAIREAAASLKA